MNTRKRVLYGIHDKAFASTAIFMVREVLLGAGFALLLPLRSGLDGVLYSMPVSDLLTFAICVFVIRYTYKTLGCETTHSTDKT